MSNDMPDWLRDLSKGINDSADDISMEMEPEPELELEPQLQPEPDPMADLRSQMNEESERAVAEPMPAKAAPRARRRSSSKRGVMGLLPWQGFFLSVLLFLDVAFVGLLFLVMLGRVAFPLS
ncbi:MAG: hypothetical protein JXA21_12710 [Anaerolineae bacterium]|nr:hypothetical protein [Anaerolineae bacterium]